MALVVVLIFAMVPMALCVLIGRVFPRLMQFLFGCAIGAAIIFLASQQ
jgi:hypothetical protein